MAAKLANTGCVYGMDGRLERGGSHDSANLIGGCIFFWVDRWIFGDKKVRSRKKKVAASAEGLAKAEVVVGVSERNSN